MLVGVLSDTHDEFGKTQYAVDLFTERGVSVLVHCGDLVSARIVEICSPLKLYFVLGNHDADSVPELQEAAERCGATCMGWGGEFTLEGSRIAISHGHMTMDIRPLLKKKPDYLLSGHTHYPDESWNGPTHRICPGALHRTENPSVAIIDLTADRVEFITLPS